MNAVLVANPKGGSGKTTIATNLSAALAGRGERVSLYDLDRQQSSETWLAIRPPGYSRIESMRTRALKAAGREVSAGWLIIDSPAGLHGKNLNRALRLANKVIVPVQPSLFDMASASDFFQTLAEEKVVRKGRAYVGIVGMRVDARTRAAATLEAFLAQYGLPILGYLRDTQKYVNAAFNGLGIFDLPDNEAHRDIDQWRNILDWIAN